LKELTDSFESDPHLIMSFGNVAARYGTLLRRPVWTMLTCPTPSTSGANTPSAPLPATFVRTITKHRVRVLREMKSREGSFDVAPHKLRARSEWADWNYSAEIFAFNKRLSENFEESSLQIAFTHSSYVNVEKKRRNQLQLSNEEFHIEHNQQFVERGQTHLNHFLPQYLRCYLPQLPEEGIQ
jgi:dsRNA-specific ribonuclease